MIKKFANSNVLIFSKCDNENIKYIKLPYIGDISKIVKFKIAELVKRYCIEEINVRIAFNTFKISRYFSIKDTYPGCFKSNVIYKFKCVGCNSCYVGRTHVYFNTRMYEHLNTDKNSAVFKHIKNNPQCKNDFNSFSILDLANNDYELAVKEAMHIKWVNPDLNGQKKHEIIALSI